MNSIDPRLLPLLPPQVKLLAQIIGLHDVMALIEARGGLPVYVPKHADKAGELKTIISNAALRALCAEHGGTTIDVPKLDVARGQLKAIIIRAERAAGASAREVAVRYRLTRRRVVQIGRDDPADDHPDLFGEHE